MFQTFRRHHFALLFYAISLSIICLQAIGVGHVSFFVLPNKIKKENFNTCYQQLETKSYLLKQFILENINNSKIWLQNRNSSFFDTRWFAISYYEHDGKEWILKDFKINPISIDIYKVLPSDFIKAEQKISKPHRQSNQISTYYQQVAELPIFFISSANTLSSINKNHLVRISLFSDLVSSVISTDSTCEYSLLTSKGEFILNTTLIPKNDILTQLQDSKNINLSNNNINTFHAENEFYISKKIFSDLSVLVRVKGDDSALQWIWLQFLFPTLIILFFINTLLFLKVNKRLTERVEYISNNLSQLNRKNHQIIFDLSSHDELTKIDEQIAHLYDKKTKDSFNQNQS